MPRGVFKNGNNGLFKKGSSGGPGSSKGWKHTEETREKMKGIKKRGVKQSQGYRLVYQGNGKYQLEHRYMVEKFLGRKLSSNEKVHHIDGDRLNNSIENLILCSQSEHIKLHFSLEKVAYELVKKGFIFFNKIKRIYALREGK